MSFNSRNTLIAFAVLLASATGVMAQARMARVTQDTPACTNWAGWREWVQASLTPKGARPNKFCPSYLRKGSKVEIVEEDAGEGATSVRWQGKVWYTHGDRLK